MSGSGAVPVSLRGDKLRLRETGGDLMLVGGGDPRAWRRRDGEPAWRSVPAQVPLASWVRQTRRLKSIERDLEVLSSGLDEFSALWTLGLRDTVARLQRRRDRARMLQAFLATLPEEALARALRFSEGQWQVLQLQLRCPPALELVDSNPMIAFCLASGAAFHPHAAARRWTEVRRLLARRRRVATEWLGFGKTEAVVKLLRKIPAESITLQRALRRREAMADPGVSRLLAHVGRLNAGALRIAVDPALRLASAPRLLEEIGQTRAEDRRPRAHRLLEDTLGLVREVGGRGVPQLFSSLEEIRAHHDDLVNRLVTARPRQRAPRRRFPPPPVPGTETIVPLARSADLVEEGRQQHNCVATYSRRVLAGKVYIYRVLAPARATLSVVPRRGLWVRESLLGLRNQPVRREVVLVVDSWLHCSRPRVNTNEGRLVFAEV